MSAFSSTADIHPDGRYVSFVPKGDMLESTDATAARSLSSGLPKARPGGSIRATHGKHNGRSLVPAQAGRRQ
jgi:hypothetical protein